jgi:hypothetical protein
MRSAGVDVVSSYVITKLSASFYTDVTHNLYRLTNCAPRQDAKWKARGIWLVQSDLYFTRPEQARGLFFIHSKTVVSYS